MGPELISPNLHVVLIHYPLGLLILGTLIELLAFLWRHSSFRLAGRWMILLGALAAVPATFSGIYALNDVARANNPAGDEAIWAQVQASSPTFSHPDVWARMCKHLILQSASTAVCAGVVVVWLGLSDRSRRSWHLPLLAVLVAGSAGIVVGAWFGGEGVYRQGVAVDTHVPSPPPAAPASQHGGDLPPALQTALRYAPPLMEIHVIAAGTAVAVALAAIGLSFRKLNASYEWEDDRRPIIPSELTVAEANAGRPTPGNPMSLARSFNPDIEVSAHPTVSAARFWLLAFVLALLTAAGGALLLARDADVWSTAQHSHQPLPAVWWNQIKPAPGEPKVNRLLAHFAAGSTLVLTPLVLALLARFAPRRRFWLSLFTLLLVLAVAAQTWLGVLLLLDTSDGPVTRFNQVGSVSQEGQ